MLKKIRTTRMLKKTRTMWRTMRMKSIFRISLIYEIPFPPSDTLIPLKTTFMYFRTEQLEYSSK